MPSYEITSYRVALRSSQPSAQSETIARITLSEGAPGSTVIRGHAYFYPDGSTLPAPQVTPATISVYYHVAQLAAVLEFLRVETPIAVYGTVDGELISAGLSTSPYEPVGEPIGEEEGSAG